MKANELQQKIADGEKMRVLDCRESEEVAAKDSGIPGAENIPMGQVFVEVGKEASIYQNKKQSRNTKFTNEEDRFLQEGMKKYGRTSWKLHPLLPNCAQWS